MGKDCTHMKYEVKHNGDMGMGHLCLIMGGAFMAKWVGNLWLIMGGALGCGYGLNRWGSYDKVSCCFVWKYAKKMLVFRGVPFPIIA